MKNNINANSPIGVFDSGVGGLTVLREMTRLMPNEDMIYFGDEANAPYGAHTHGEVREIALGVAGQLTKMGVKALTVACNTATAAAVDALRAAYPDVPVIGTEPALKLAADAGYRRILALATPVTVAEKRFSALVNTRCGGAEVIAVPCPGLATMIEENEPSSAVFDGFLDSLIAPYRGKFDAVVLGCTHYPLIKDTIAHAVGNDIPIFDGAAGTARQVLRRLSEVGMCAPADKHGKVTLISSKDTARLCGFWSRIVPDNKKRTDNGI